MTYDRATLDALAAVGEANAAALATLALRRATERVAQIAVKSGLAAHAAREGNAALLRLSDTLLLEDAIHTPHDGARWAR